MAASGNTIKNIEDLPDDVVRILYENPPPYSDVQEETLDDLFRKYEIPESYSYKKPDGSTEFYNHWEELRTAKSADITIVVDDSGSMAAQVKNGKGVVVGTRWSEAAEIAKIQIEIAAVLDSDGCDVVFLNRGTVNKVRSYSQVASKFADPPAGGTPLTDVMTNLLARPSNPDKVNLYIIITDGEPTVFRGSHAVSDTENFIRLIKSRDGTRNFICFMAATDDEDAVGWMDRVDTDDATISTLDDYESERKQVKKFMGMAFNYSKGCHAIRSFLAPFYAKYDTMDGL